MDDDVRIMHIEQGPKLEEIRGLFAHNSAPLSALKHDPTRNEFVPAHRQPHDRTGRTIFGGREVRVSASPISWRAT